MKVLIMVDSEIQGITASPDNLTPNQLVRFWDNLRRHYGESVYLAESVVIMKKRKSAYTHVLASIVTGTHTICRTIRMVNKGDIIARANHALMRSYPKADYIHTQEVQNVIL